MNSSNEQRSAKRTYRAPALTVYGSVRELTGTKSGASMGDATMRMSTEASDPACKHNVVRVGEHPAGFGVYLFDYKPEFARFGTGRQFGVMADEVEQILPEAVSVGADGYRRVDYPLLGVTRH
ncbi:MAG: tail fiber domain-containing protein [Novosphingobium sp.]|nr:tail fiber domain-containing protein [Novosphingobium sp.]